MPMPAIGPMPIEPACPAVALGPTGLFDADSPPLQAAAAIIARSAVAEKKILMCLVHFHWKEFGSIVSVFDGATAVPALVARRLAGISRFHGVFSFVDRSAEFHALPAEDTTGSNRQMAG